MPEMHVLVWDIGGNCMCSKVFPAVERKSLRGDTRETFVESLELSDIFGSWHRFRQDRLSGRLTSKWTELHKLVRHEVITIVQVDLPDLKKMLATQ